MPISEIICDICGIKTCDFEIDGGGSLCKLCHIDIEIRSKQDEYDKQQKWIEDVWLSKQEDLQREIAKLRWNEVRLRYRHVVKSPDSAEQP